MGISLKVRGDLYIEQKLNRIVSEWRNYRGGSFSGLRSSSGSLSRERSLAMSDSNYSYLGRQSNIPKQQVRSTAFNPSPIFSESRVRTPEPAKDTSSSKEEGSWCIIL